MSRKDDRAKKDEKKEYVSVKIAKETMAELNNRLVNPRLRKQERRLVKRAIARLVKAAEAAEIVPEFLPAHEVVGT